MKQLSLDPGCWDLGGRLQFRMIGQSRIPDETDRVSTGGCHFWRMTLFELKERIKAFISQHKTCQHDKANHVCVL